MESSKVYTQLKALIPSIIFNFRYLPFKQAIKLPILVYKPHFLKLGGAVVIESEKIYHGMIKLGFFTSAIYPNTGITFKNEGLITFKGKCRIGNDCYIVVGKNSHIDFGDDFKVTAGFKITSMCGISFGRQTRFGWGCLVFDTNFHPLYDIEKKKFKKAFGKIHIGDNNWFATQCMIMPSVQTPERCIFGARTIVTRGGHYEPYCLHGGSPIRILSRNVKLIIEQDSIKDYTIETQ